MYACTCTVPLKKKLKYLGSGSVTVRYWFAFGALMVRSRYALGALLVRYWYALKALREMRFGSVRCSTVRPLLRLYACVAGARLLSYARDTFFTPSDQTARQ